MKYEQKRTTPNPRRQQQVRRQLLGIGIVVGMLAGLTINSFSEGKESLDGENKTVEDKVSEQQVVQAPIEEETVEEQVARVRKQAEEEQYPSSIVELLDKNDETVTFVEDYAEKKDLPCAETVGEDYTEGEIPLLLQWDERWGYAPYGTGCVATSGCGPTCLSMVIVGLTGDTSVTPDKVAAYGQENKALDEENNTYWAFMREGAQHWNLACYEGDLSEEQVQTELEAGHPIICSVGPGDFTKIGHFIVLIGYSQGEVTVHDPFSIKNSSRTWNYNEIKSQTNAMWIYSVKE